MNSFQIPNLCSLDPLVNLHIRQILLIVTRIIRSTTAPHTRLTARNTSAGTPKPSFDALARRHGAVVVFAEADPQRLPFLAAGGCDLRLRFG